MDVGTTIVALYVTVPTVVAPDLVVKVSVTVPVVLLGSLAKKDVGGVHDVEDTPAFKFATVPLKPYPEYEMVWEKVFDAICIVMDPDEPIVKLDGSVIEDALGIIVKVQVPLQDISPGP